LVIEKPKPRLFIEVIESMRGIAALGVVCYHFANGTLPTLIPNSFGSFFDWARLGIPLFFIISGFVIPYSMYSAGYTLRDAGRYLLKRMARMAPPAWASIGIIFCIYFGALAFKGEPIDGMTWPGTSLKALMANMWFSFKLFDVEKYIEVYWTLEVEFQFYIIIALILPLILKFCHNQIALSLILIGLNGTYFFHADRILFFELNSYFILGILLFLYRMNLIKRNYFIYASVLAATACYMQIGIKPACASIIGVLLIAFVRFENPVTNFLGMISFSLYITHHHAGVVAEIVLRNLYLPNPTEPIKFAMFLTYLAIAIAFGWVFYKLIEVPSLNWSKRISIKPRKK
jgi:peptidoglycan/LPS O-acetylase OafA/YrhL